MQTRACAVLVIYFAGGTCATMHGHGCGFAHLRSVHVLNGTFCGGFHVLQPMSRCAFWETRIDQEEKTAYPGVCYDDQTCHRDGGVQSQKEILCSACWLESQVYQSGRLLPWPLQHQEVM